MEHTQSSGPDSTQQATARMPHLPDEIKLKIFEHFIPPLPKGIHSARWPIVSRMRIERYTVPGIFPLVAEALYKKNRIIITPTIVYERNPVTLTDRFDEISIRYPKPEVNHWVRELEVLIPCERWSDELLVNWIKKLAEGRLGFQNLELLRIVIDGNFIGNFMATILAIGPLRFRTKRFELVVADHTCHTGCDSPFIYCQYYKDLMSHITLHEDPIEELAQNTVEEEELD